MDNKRNASEASCYIESIHLVGEGSLRGSAGTNGVIRVYTDL